jgi:hypothetical protein
MSRPYVGPQGRILFAAFATVGLLVLSSPPLQGQMSPKEMHDRLTVIIRQNTAAAVPQGDTFVTWAPSPILYSTVARDTHCVRSSLLRNDGMVGIARACWDDGRQSRVTITWGIRDSVSFSLEIARVGDRLVGTGEGAFNTKVPTIPWAIADYGMEDQEVPLLRSIVGDSVSVALYRPYAAKWDTVAVWGIPAGKVGRIRLRTSAGEEWSYLLAIDGALLQTTRSRYPDFERRPLELGPRYQEYLRLRR